MDGIANGRERDYRISAVGKAITVLDAFALPPHRFSLSELAAATGLSANQAFRVLRTLVATGYVRQEPAGKTYRLGARLFALLPALAHGEELIAAGRDALDAIAGQTGEFVSLIVLEDEATTICIDAREPGRHGGVATGVGTRSTHLHAGAAGKLLLASLPDATIVRYLADNQPLHRYTEQTPGSAEAVWAAVRAIREQGLAVSLGEVAAEMYGVAAPVHDRRGAVAGAVTLAGSLVRCGAGARERHLAAVVDAGRRISINLGYRATVAFG